MKNRLLSIVLCFALYGNCQSNDQIPLSSHEDEENNDNNNNSEPDYSILFVGNSLTISNNLPQLVENIASEAGITIQTSMVAFSNYGLEDHWFDRDIQGMISTNQYDYVVIQQGPSSQAYGRSSLIQYGGYIKEICEENNTQLAYFMVWPSIAYYHTFSGVIKNYTDAANINEALLCAVGLHWKNAIEQTNDYSYYGHDGFHPSLEGSKAAAHIILQSLGIL